MRCGKTAALLLLLGALTVLGCRKGATEEELNRKTEAVSAPETPPSPPPAKRLTPSKPKAATAAEKSSLGTLPDSIGIPVGQQVPRFEALDATGKSVALNQLLAKGKILLIFYRGGW